LDCEPLLCIGTDWNYVYSVGVEKRC
jgi:hypothetical protein